MSNISERFTLRVHERAAELYGEHLPKVVSDRIEEELELLTEYKADKLMLAISDIFKEVGLAAEDVYDDAYCGGSFLGYLLDINGGIDPLPPHYRCEHCKHSEFDVPETVRAGIELPEKICPVCGKPMIGEGFSIDPWFFYGSPEDIQAFIHSIQYDKPENKLCAYNFLSYRVQTDKLATVSDALSKVEGISNVKEFYNELLKKTGVDTLYHKEWKMRFHDDVELTFVNTKRTDFLSNLAALTNVRPGMIPIDNSSNTLAVREALSSQNHIFSVPVDAQSVKDFLRQGAPFLGIEELLFKHMGNVLTYFRPNCFYDLVRCIAIYHGTGVWNNNTEPLLRDGTIKPSELPVCCEDVFEYLQKAGFDKKTAFSYAWQKIKQDELSAEQENELRTHGVPDWFIEHYKAIHSIETKSYAISGALAAWRLLYYRFCVVDQETFCQTFIDSFHLNATK